MSLHVENRYLYINIYTLYIKRTFYVYNNVHYIIFTYICVEFIKLQFNNKRIQEPWQFFSIWNA